MIGWYPNLVNVTSIDYIISILLIIKKLLEYVNKIILSLPHLGIIYHINRRLS